jgi:hypothetical protein
MKKLDRFERMVGELAGSLRLPVVPNEHDDSLHARWRTALIAQFTHLLRREHQATVRAVKRLRKYFKGVDGPSLGYKNGYQAACNDILAMLERRKS